MASLPRTLVAALFVLASCAQQPPTSNGEGTVASDSTKSDTLASAEIRITWEDFLGYCDQQRALRDSLLAEGLEKEAGEVPLCESP